MDERYKLRDMEPRSGIWYVAWLLNTLGSLLIFGGGAGVVDGIRNGDYLSVCIGVVILACGGGLIWLAPSFIRPMVRRGRRAPVMRRVTHFDGSTSVVSMDDGEAH